MPALWNMLTELNLDAMLLTETGAPVGDANQHGLFAAPCIVNPALAGCAIMVAKWHHATLVDKANSGCYIAVKFPVSNQTFYVAAAYAPAGPLLDAVCQHTSIFWSELTAAVLKLDGPTWLGIDANYTDSPVDTLHPKHWRSVPAEVPELCNFWTLTALHNVKATLPPDTFEPTYMQGCNG